MGTISVKVTVTDPSNASASDVFTLSTMPVNHAPTVADPLVDQQTEERQPFSYQFAADAFADQDPGTDLIYTATLANGDQLPA